MSKNNFGGYKLYQKIDFLSKSFEYICISQKYWLTIILLHNANRMERVESRCVYYSLFQKIILSLVYIVILFDHTVN